MSLHRYPRPRHHRNMERPLVPAGLPPPEAGVQPDPGVGLAGLRSGLLGTRVPQRGSDWCPLQSCTLGEKQSNKRVWCYSMGLLWQ